MQLTVIRERSTPVWRNGPPGIKAPKATDQYIENVGPNRTTYLYGPWVWTFQYNPAEERWDDLGVDFTYH